MTKEVLSLGHDVVAAIRSPDTMSDLSTQYPNQLATVKCDVTSQTDVDATFASITQKFGRLDVVWNNAGYSVAGEIEAVEVDDVKALFEVNVWGALRVSKAAVRYFREVNRPAGGRLIQASSLMGLVVSVLSPKSHASIASLPACRLFQVWVITPRVNGPWKPFQKP